ncbi:hypothetical protein GH733_008656 [Mirounga leonina]|nr:hypothetical protein GH733_008656 [Mirounga leonina]
MASTDYSTYSQAAAQQGYSAYTAQPTQGYAQTTQAYGQQSDGAHGQPTDVSHTQAQTTETYGQTILHLLMDRLPLVYSQAVQGHGTGAYDATTATVTTTQPPMQLSLHIALGLLTQLAATAPARLQDGNKPAETRQPQSSTGVYNQPSLGYGQSNYSYSQSRHDHLILLPPIPLYCQPTSYDQNSYSQQNSYGQPRSYGQQSSYGQQLPTSYGPPALSPTPKLNPTARLQVHIANRAAATGSRVHSNRTSPSSMGIYGQDSGGFSRPGENGSMSGPDNGGRGRGGFDRGEQGKGRSGIGAGERGGFNKPGGPMDEGPDLDLGPPVDRNEDSDNSAIYAQGLDDNVT